ncbi:MerR family transcriptional regulator [Pseudooceanicola sp. C21-150M6]|uniref:MerR family transcriptional regulator n=1 Tax=Pseudooceanicola sp. C21-150M6 TaxID=3434355 RepID=UPI003D7F2977
MAKSADAFRTISEVSEWLDTPAHVLRFWESKFTQVKPVKRAGGRRYYRPSDMELLGGIKRLLHDDGMTIKGVQKLLRDKGIGHVAALSQPLDDVTQAVANAMEAKASQPQADPAPTPAPELTSVPAPEPKPAPVATTAPGPAVAPTIPSNANLPHPSVEAATSHQAEDVPEQPLADVSAEQRRADTPAADLAEPQEALTGDERPAAGDLFASSEEDIPEAPMAVDVPQDSDDMAPATVTEVPRPLMAVSDVKPAEAAVAAAEGPVSASDAPMAEPSAGPGEDNASTAPEQPRRPAPVASVTRAVPVEPHKPLLAMICDRTAPLERAELAEVRVLSARLQGWLDRHAG